VDSILGENGYALEMVENVRPLINKENLGPARESIYDAYMEHVIVHSPGYPKLASWSGERIVPSQALVGRMLYEYAQESGVNLIAAGFPDVRITAWPILLPFLYATARSSPGSYTTSFQRSRYLYVTS